MLSLTIPMVTFKLQIPRDDPQNNWKKSILLINPDVKCEIIMKSPKSGQNTRQFINENKGETPVRTSDLIGMFHIDNPNINAQELKIKGLIYTTQMYRLRRNCSWDYGIYSNLF